VRLCVCVRVCMSVGALVCVWVCVCECVRAHVSVCVDNLKNFPVEKKKIA